jgi:hypothetical protein
LKHARLDAVAKHGNLADPDYEPTDDELRELAHSAFADVAARNEQALRKIHEHIAELREGARRRRTDSTMESAK